MRPKALILFFATLLTSLAVALAAQPALRLKSGRVPSPVTQPESLRLAGAPQEAYFVVQYAYEPGDADIQVLQARNLRVVSYLPDQAVIAAGVQDPVCRSPVRS